MKICENCKREISDLSQDCSCLSKSGIRGKIVRMQDAIESQNKIVDQLFHSVHNDKIILATKGSRFVNYLVDSFVLYILFILIFVLVSSYHNFLDKSVYGFLIFAVYLSCPLYYIICESIWGKTLGKVITKTKVIDSDGSKAGLGLIIARTLCRRIPFEPLSYLFGSQRPNGRHDSISGTITVSERG